MTVSLQQEKILTHCQAQWEDHMKTQGEYYLQVKKNLGNQQLESLPFRPPEEPAQPVSSRVASGAMR